MSQDFKITWSPGGVSLPEKLGLFAYENATGLPGITALTIAAATSDQGWDLENCNDLLTLSFPNLASLTDSGALTVLDSTSLTTLLLPSLVSTDAGSLFIQGNTALAGLSLPALVTTNNSFTFRNNSAATSFSAPNWLPTNNINIVFTGNALDQASVDGILARCVANAGYVSGLVQLGGGTNSAPSVTGAADAATLTGRGVTVTTN